MSIIDRFIAAITPPETAEARLEARSKATEAASPGDWLDQILQHHMDIEDAFLAVKSATDAQIQRQELKNLGVLLTGHSIAEEAVIYPALAKDGEKTHAAMGYDEQAMVKVQMALLEQLPPLSQDFLDRLEHIEGAVAHHMYAEEGNWFLDLKEAATPEQETLLTLRYSEEYTRYVGQEALT
ncbi:hemerythrin domain-containing protein [Altererythrobacter xixiisoli]|uniref:Hemerythrin domain-containing protein n=2 Tax=Croceibacterium xixiisoli TaxID=1476466 RepID=A0A6I4TQS7_9SPHN|nr:hemerythrin domain-containing protein [Croceibacterium xixiisoli]MXO98234.1 hemerythrin domain-containing protein [Croceibacterium xixiisoli]